MPRTKRWSVYLLRCDDGSLYAGIAVDLVARIAVHNAGKGAKYTKPRLPVMLVWHRRLPATAARTLEYRLKRLPKAKKELLVSGASLRSVFSAARTKK